MKGRISRTKYIWVDGKPKIAKSSKHMSQIRKKSTKIKEKEIENNGVET